MQTIISRLDKAAQEIKEMLTDLTINYSSVERWNNNDMNSGVVFIGGDYRWKELAADGKQLQSQVLKKYTQLYALLKLLIRDLPDRDIQKIDKKSKTVFTVIEHSNLLYDPSKEKPLRDAIDAINQQIKTLEGVYDPRPGENIYIPDTNALIGNANVEAWSFNQTDEFTLLLLPVVLSELDKLKIDGKREDLRDKAKLLINKIKEYRRRGSLFEGVPLAGKRRIRSTAVEPDFTNALSWLTAENNDDRIIAAYFEVVRENPRSNVVLVTSDINLQNKAEFAGVIFDEPPE